MKNNSLLILLAVVIFFGVLCAVAAGVALSFYNGNLSMNDLLSAQTPSPSGSAAVPQAQPAQATQTQAPVERLPQTNEDTIYLMDLMQKYQFCQTGVSVFNASKSQWQADPDLLKDANFIESITTQLDQIDNNCTSLGKKEGVPDTYRALNKELLQVNKQMNIFLDNYREWLTYRQDQYVINGDQALTTAVEHLNEAGYMIQEALNP